MSIIETIIIINKTEILKSKSEFHHLPITRQDKKRKRLECYKTIGQSKDLEEAMDKVNYLIENKKFLESKLTQMMKMITDMEKERNF